MLFTKEPRRMIRTDCVPSTTIWRRGKDCCACCAGEYAGSAMLARSLAGVVCMSRRGGKSGTHGRPAT